MEISNRYGRLQIIAFSTLVFLKSAIIFSIITSFPHIQYEYSLNNTELGLIITFYYLFSLFGSSIWMTFIVKFKKNTILILGGIIWIFGIIILVFSVNYWMIILAISIMGFGGESLSIVSYDSYDDLVKYRNRGKSVSLLYILQGLGGLFGIFVAGFLEGTLFMPWKHLIGLLGVFCFFFLSTSLVFLIKLEIKKPKEANNLTIKEIDLSNSDSQPIYTKINKDLVKSTFKNRINLLIFILIFFYIPFYHFNNIWLQKYWIDIHGLTQTMASISIIFTSGGEFLGILLSGILIDKFRKRKGYNVPKIGIISGFLAVPLYVIGYLLAWSFNTENTANMGYLEVSVFMLINAFGELNIFLSYTSLFFAFLFNQMIGVLFLTIILDFNKKPTRDFAINFQLVIINLGHLIAPVLGGYIGDLLTLKYVLLLVPVACLIAALFFIGITKTANKNIEIIEDLKMDKNKLMKKPT